MIGYDSSTSTLSDFVVAASDGFGGTLITVDHDGTGALNSPVVIDLQSAVYSASVLDDMIANGNLVLA